VIIGCVVAVVVLAIVFDAGLYYNKVHAGVSVATVGLGGKTEDEAVAALTSYVSKAQATPITLTHGEKSWLLYPADVGAKIDVAGAVAQAMDVTRGSNFFGDIGRRWKSYFSKTDLPLVGTVDRALLDDFLAKIARELDQPPVNAALSMENGQIKVVEGQNGLVVDREALRSQLEPLLLAMQTAEIPMPMVEKEPEVKVEDYREAIEQAQTMIGSPITVTNSGHTWILTPAEIGRYMDFKSESQNGVSTLVPYFSAEKLAPFFDKIAPDVANPPVDATFDSDGTKAWVVPGVLGEELDRDATAVALTEAALKKSGRTVAVAVKTTEPEFTTAEAEAYGIKDLLASYTTEPYRGSANRQVNVRITTQYASDKFLAPGEEYDFDKTIGPRTPERGYKTAPGIVGNGELEDVLGGGICQVSTTLFNAVFEAGLKVLERHNHSLYIDHYPDGRDATVAGGGGKNFRFMNDTDHYIWIRGTSDGVTTTFNIYGTKDGRTAKITFNGWSYGEARTEVTVLNTSLSPGATHVKISGQSGRSCSVTRVITYADGTKKTEKWSSYYPMIPKTIEVGPTTTTTWKPTTTTKPGATTSTVVTEF
jgi:vancomycin resistance protein YoaR